MGGALSSYVTSLFQEGKERRIIDGVVVGVRRKLTLLILSPSAAGGGPVAVLAVGGGAPYRPSNPTGGAGAKGTEAGGAL